MIRWVTGSLCAETDPLQPSVPRWVRVDQFKSLRPANETP